MKVLSVDQIYQADKITLKNQHIDSIQLMERAGHKIYDWLEDRFHGSKVRFHIFCGVGNNGGDGLVVGRLLIEKGYQVKIYVVNYSNKKSEEFTHNCELNLNLNKDNILAINCDKYFPEIKPEDIIIDAIFGIGLNRSPEGWVRNLIQYLNKSDAFKIAIDIPSGIFASKALTDETAIFKADHTLTLQAPKLSFFLPETSPFVSDFDVLDIGLDVDFMDKAEPLAQLITNSDAIKLYKLREKFGHKGTYGHALIVGGSYGKIGAAVLSTRAAFRMGAGMLSVFVPSCGYNILQTAIPEAMVITDKENDFITDITVDFEPSAIGIGIGMGKNNLTVEALKEFLKSTQAPLVIDADALNMISENRELLEILPKSSILTPHPGELKRLIGIWKDDYEKLEKVKQFSTQHDVIVIIKGAYTVTVDKEKIYINTSGNPGMGTAGSGDVLTGVITGLLSQGYDHLSAATFGVYMHGKAGDIAAAQMGEEAVMAGDIVDYISKAYLELFSQWDGKKSDSKSFEN